MTDFINTVAAVSVTLILSSLAILFTVAAVVIVKEEFVRRK